MAPATESPAALLEMRGIEKSYPGVRALDGVDLTVREGEVAALVGENGAGKSTLIKILAGAQHMDRGEIRLGGAPVRVDSPSDAMELGIGDLPGVQPGPQLTVMGNIFLGREPAKAGWLTSAEWRPVRRPARSGRRRGGGTWWGGIGRAATARRDR